MGFRGIVLTAIVGRYLDSTYDPTKNFYRCNPRSIFENGIRYALIENQIPCGKSDPLNVAKNAMTLDMNWAKGRRPENAAVSAVKFLRNLQKHSLDSNEGKKMVDHFFLSLINLKKQIQEIEIRIPNLMSSELLLASKIAQFAYDCPEGGTVPQFIFGLLLSALRKSQREQILVNGTEESVFGTNTTSKKPGDIWETVNEEVIASYEVTVKPISLNRLQDCYDNISQLSLKNVPIRFICRIPEDIQEIDFDSGYLVYKFKDIIFEFISLEQWIIMTYLNLPQSGRIEVINSIQEFITKFDRPQKTKKFWNGLWAT